MNVLATTTVNWDDAIVAWTVDCGFLVVAVGILACLFRVIRGPHLADRAIALDTIGVHVIALIILLTLRLDSLVLFDGALVLSLVAFAGTVAVAQYIVRPHRRRRARAASADRRQDS